MQKKSKAPVNAFRPSEMAESLIYLGLLLLFGTDAGHDRLHNWFDIIGGQSEGLAVGKNLDGFSSTVNNNLAGLAFLEMFLQTCADLWAGSLFHVVAEFGEELSAAKHGESLFPRERNVGQVFRATSCGRAAPEL